MALNAYQEFKSYLHEARYQVSVTVFSILMVWMLGLVVPATLMSIPIS